MGIAHAIEVCRNRFSTFSASAMKRKPNKVSVPDQFRLYPTMSPRSLTRKVSEPSPPTIRSSPPILSSPASP